MTSGERKPCRPVILDGIVHNLKPFHGMTRFARSAIRSQAELASVCIRVTIRTSSELGDMKTCLPAGIPCFWVFLMTLRTLQRCMLADQGKLGCIVVKVPLDDPMEVLSRMTRRTRLRESPVVRVCMAVVAKGECHVCVLDRLSVRQRLVVAVAAGNRNVLTGQRISGAAVGESRSRFPRRGSMAR